MKFLFYLLLFFPSILLAQTAMKGVVTDNEKQPLPLSNIVLLHKNTGTITDEKGVFTLFNILPTDSIKISNVAYYPKILAINDLANNDTILLIEKVQQLNNVIIRDLSKYNKEIMVGMNGYPNNGEFKLAPGNQLATFIANNEDKEGWIKSVSFKVKAVGKCNNNMRVRLLQLDTVTFKPSTDLLNENVLIKSGDLKKTVDIDLSAYKIIMPKEGIFILLEWLSPEKDCSLNSYTSIAANLSTPNNIVWFNYRDKAWKTSNRPRLPNGNYMTPNVALKVAY